LTKYSFLENEISPQKTMLGETILSRKNIVKKTPERKNESLSLVQPSVLFYSNVLYPKFGKFVQKN
jgi:hypothetical protein